MGIRPEEPTAAKEACRNAVGLLAEAKGGREGKVWVRKHPRSSSPGSRCVLGKLVKKTSATQTVFELDDGAH